jgi:hypothetical protein
LAIEQNVQFYDIINFSLFHYLAIKLYDFFHNFQSSGPFKLYKHDVVHHNDAVLDYNKSLSPSQLQQHNFTTDHTC